jgi:cell division protein FtsN
VNPMKKNQLGGTFIGIVIGIVIGLAAALAVAVYVTKVPIPFLNKGASRAPDQDAAEARKNKDWDPNAPLYGKSPARAPMPAASGTVTANPAPASALVAPAVVGGTPARAASAAVSAPVTPAPAVRADPLGDLAKAKAAAAPRAKLSLIGLEAKVTEREQSGRTVYRVRVGPFDKKEEADKQKERLEAGGVEAALVRVQR